MKLCGIIAEFNPLTNGHNYIINQVKKQTGANVAIIMSGSFTQRGELAILNKFTRAKHAICSGADIVVELPACFTLSSAPFFALGGVKILASLGIDSLAFGVKIKDTNKLIEVAKLKSQEDKKISNTIISFMKLGQNYSKALYQTYKLLYPHLSCDLDTIFSEPNNILAIEYLSAIYSNGLDITPIFINRKDGGYNNNRICTVKIFGKKTKLVNATYIRSLIKSAKTRKIKKLIPSFVYDDIKKTKYQTESETRLDALTISKIRSLSNEDLMTFADFNTGLAHLTKQNATLLSTRKEICNALSSKCYRPSRISKLLLLPSLGIKKDFAKTLEKPYAINVLAVATNKRKMLSEIIASAKCDLIVSLSDLQNMKPEKGEFIRQNQTASNLYNICNKMPQTVDKTIFVSNN